jgi:hypothetical protein
MDKYMEIRILRIFVLLLSLFWVTSSYAQEPQPIGIVTAVKGEVIVVSAGKSQAVEKGTSVFLGDRFETKEASGVKILFDDDTLVSLGENTNFDITEFVYTPKERKSYYNIFKGKLKGIVQRLEDRESNVEFATPNAVAGIKGTTEYIDADTGEIGLEDSEIGLFVRRKDGAWEFTLVPGEYINTFQREPVPKPITPEFKQKFENLIEEVTGDEEFEEVPEEELPTKAEDLTPFGAPGIPPILQDPADILLNGNRTPVDVVIPPPPVQQGR